MYVVSLLRYNQNTLHSCTSNVGLNLWPALYCTILVINVWEVLYSDRYLNDKPAAVIDISIKQDTIAPTTRKQLAS